MTTGLMGQKLGMTQLFLDGGRAVPVTVIEAGPCRVSQVKTKERDGYAARARVSPHQKHDRG